MSDMRLRCVGSVFVEPCTLAKGFLFGGTVQGLGCDADRKEADKTVWVRHSDDGSQRLETVAYAALIPA